MSTNILKLIALICMLLDHIAEFSPDCPVWFEYIGRIAAPIFFYCSAWGLHYTHNRISYTVRLYVLGIVMSIGDIIVACALKNEVIFANNIFTTLFLGCAIVLLLNKAVDCKKKILLGIALIIQQIVAFIFCFILAEKLGFPGFVDMYMLYHAYGAIFGSAIFTEGSIGFVLFFVIMYYLKDKKTYLTGFMLMFALAIEFMVRRTYYMRGPASYLIPYSSFQWMMIMAVPFIWLYNGKKGKGNKWFYYVFYPTHIWILCIINNI